MQWLDDLADQSLHDLPYKIELNEKGIIEMTPASFIQSLLQENALSLFHPTIGFIPHTVKTQNT